MRHILTLLIFIFSAFSCSKERIIAEEDKIESLNSLTFMEALATVKAKEELDVFGLTSIPNTKVTTINFQDFYGYNACSTSEKTANGITFKATHGNSSVKLNDLNPTDTYYLSISAANNPSDNLPNRYGGGMVIKYPFKQGSIYTVKTNISGTEFLYSGTQPTGGFPTLQARLTNSPTTAAICSNTPPIFLTGSSEPTQIFPAISKGVSKAVTLTFTADQCYEYLWLSALPNTAGRSSSSADLVTNLVIIENNQFAISGADNLVVDQQATFFVEAFSLPISSNFTWTVTGDLQIVGSNQGPTATIKRTGMGLGKIYVSLNGCQNIIEKTLAAQTITLGIESMTNLQDSPNGTSFTVLPGIGNYKYTGVLKLKNLNNVPTGYSWSKVSGSTGVPLINWSSSGSSVTVMSKGVGGFIKLRCTATAGSNTFSKDYTFYMGISPM